MAETIILHTRDVPPATGLNSDRLIPGAVVDGIELPDGTYMLGRAYNARGENRQQRPLEWPSEMVDRVAEFFDEKLVAGRTPTEYWNCHSFVAKAMGWSVAWQSTGAPMTMSITGPAIEAQALEDAQPYGIGKRWGGIIHSVIGLPDPTKCLNVRGHGCDLFIDDNRRLLEAYKGNLYRRRGPSKLVGRLASMMFTDDFNMNTQGAAPGQEPCR